LAEFERLHKVVEQDFAGVNRLQPCRLHKIKAEDDLYTASYMLQYEVCKWRIAVQI
jgi:hypothetical protein